MKFLIALVLASLIIVNGDPTSSSTSGEDSSSLEGTQLTGQMQGQLPGAFRGFGGFGRGFGGFGRGFGGGFGGLGGFGLGLGLGSMLGGGLGMGGYGMYPGAFMNPYGYGGMYGYGLPGFYQSTGAATATTPELSTSAAGAGGDLSAPAPASVPLSAPVASPSKKSTSGQFTSVLPAITNDAQTLNTINLPDIMKPYSVPMQTSTQENIKQPVIQPVNQPYLQRYVSQAQPIVQPIVNRVVQPVIHRQLKPFLTTQKIEGPAAYTTTLPAQYQSFTNQPIIGADLPSLSMPMASRAK